MKKIILGLSALCFATGANAGLWYGYPFLQDHGNGNATLTCYGSIGECARTYPQGNGAATLLTTPAAPGRVFTISRLASAEEPDTNPNPPQAPVTKRAELTATNQQVTN